MPFGSDLPTKSEPVSYDRLDAAMADVAIAIEATRPRLLDRRDLLLELAEKFALLQTYEARGAPMRSEAIYVAAMAAVVAANEPPLPLQG